MHIEHLGESTEKSLEVIIGFSNVTTYNTSISKLIALSDTRNEQFEILKISFIIIKEINKIIRENLIKYVSYLHTKDLESIIGRN